VCKSLHSAKIIAHHAMPGISRSPILITVVFICTRRLDTAAELITTVTV